MRAHRAPPVLPKPSVVDLDPEDPSQPLNDSDAVEEIDDDEVTGPWHAPDTGELYGVHVSAAEDRVAPDSDSSLGENWFESLGHTAAEGGPMPEHEVVIFDESDPHSGPSATDFRDRPKADRGAGGPGGL